MLGWSLPGNIFFVCGDGVSGGCVTVGILAEDGSGNCGSWVLDSVVRVLISISVVVVLDIYCGKGIAALVFPRSFPGLFSLYVARQFLDLGRVQGRRALSKTTS